MARFKKRFHFKPTLYAVLVLAILFCSLSPVLVMLGRQALSGGGIWLHSSHEHRCLCNTVDATVSSDGSLHVVDAREYEFAGTYTLTAKKLDPPAGSEVILHGVSVIDSKGKKTALKQTEFVPTWRDSGGPESGHFAYDDVDSTIYAFSTTKDSTKTFIFDFSYTNVIDRYADEAVLYWQFIPAGWDVDTHNITATVHLPIATGEQIKKGNNVLAFGHGDLRGSISFSKQGTIDYSIPQVNAGNFAEMRIAFPQTWVPQVSEVRTHSTKIRPKIEQEESQWQSDAKKQRILSALMLMVPAMVSVGMIVVSVILFVRYGKEYTPDFKEEYWRDVPDKDLHPAIIARIWRWNKEDINDVVASLMHLSNKGIVRLEPTTYRRRRKLGGYSDEQTYRLEWIKGKDTAAYKSLNPIDKATLRFIFQDCALGKNLISFNEIADFADKQPETFLQAAEKWQETINAPTICAAYFERKGENLKNVMIILSSFLLFVVVMFSVFLGNFSPWLGMLPGAVFMFALAFAMPRRSCEANEIQAHSKALKRWLCDFTDTEGRALTDAKVWGELFVYAYIFGISEQLADKLNKIAPEMWADPVFDGSRYWYCYPQESVAGASMLSASAYFSHAFNSTLYSARNAVSVISGDGGGGFGGGGGFSGGGGGGFGGGGGGFSR